MSNPYNSTLSPSFSQHHRPHTSHLQHSPSPDMFAILPSDMLIQKIKYTLNNHQILPIVDLPDRLLPSNPPNERNITNCITYHRGIKEERTYYSFLLNKLIQLQKILPKFNNLSPNEILAYKKRYLNEYLSAFFHKIGEECSEKYAYLAKLWQTITTIFQQLIDRLIHQLNGNKKRLYSECITTHENYQLRFQQFQKEIDQKNQQIARFKEIITKISIKKRKKCKKNKQIAYGMTQIVKQLCTLEQQRNLLEAEYINMLTLGFPGGMSYEQATKYTLNKFGIQKSLDLQYPPTHCPNQRNMTPKKSQLSNLPQTLINSDQLNDQKQTIDAEAHLKNDSPHKNQSIISSNQQNSIYSIQSDFHFHNMNEKVFKAKQKFVYTSNRFSLPFDQITSSDDDLFFQITKPDHQSYLNKKKKTYKLRISQKKSTIPKDEESIQIQSIHRKICRNTSVEMATNFGNNEKQYDKLVVNQSVQTDVIENSNESPIIKLPHATQYSIFDSLDPNPNNFSQHPNIARKKATNRFSLNYQFGMKQWEKTTNQTGSFMQEDKIIQGKQIQQRTEQNTLELIPSNLIIQQQLQSCIEGKQQKQNTKNKLNQPQIPTNTMTIKNKNKKMRSPSIYKRTSEIPTFRSTQHHRMHRRQTNRNFSHFQDEYKNTTRKTIINKKAVGHKPPNSRITINQNKSQVALSLSNSSDKQISNMFPNQTEQPTDGLQTPQQGSFINKSTSFLLKNYLFQMNHLNCINLHQKNSKLLSRIRQKVTQMGTVKRQTLISLKSVRKIIAAVYDSAFRQISKYQKMIQSLLPFEQSHKNTNDYNPSHLRLSKSSRIDTHSRKKFQSPPQPLHSNQLNLLQLLQNYIQKQYPMYKPHQIQQKIIKITKSIQCELHPNYMLKNFMLLSCLDDSIFSPMIFSNDVLFYFYLLKELQLNCQTKNINKSAKLDKLRNQSLFARNKQNINQHEQIKNNIPNNQQVTEILTANQVQNIANFTTNYQNYYTTSQHFRTVIPPLLSKYYQKQSLHLLIQQRIEISLQKIQTTLQQPLSSSSSDLRLDIFKCCQLVMEAIFSCKLTVLKSYIPLTSNCTTSTNYYIVKQIFIDILSLSAKTTINKFNLINKFQHTFINNNEKISLIQVVNFCLHYNVQDFDQLLSTLTRKYPVNDFLSKKIQYLDIIYHRYHQLGLLCTQLHQNICTTKTNNPVHTIADKNYNSKQTLVQHSYQHKKCQSVFNDNHYLIKKLTKQKPFPIHHTSQLLDQFPESSTYSVISIPIDLTIKQFDHLSNSEYPQSQHSKIQSTPLNPTTKTYQMSEPVCSKQFWEIIGVKTIHSMIHCRVVDIETEQLMNYILGKDLVGLFAASLDQLQEKNVMRGLE